MIKGISVTLYTQTQSGKDDFNRPIYTETAITVDDVLVSPAAAEDVTSELDLTGKHLEYELCIPKGDTHDWEDKKISFFGQTFRSVGPVTEYIEANVPLRWNKKVKVERYG